MGKPPANPCVSGERGRKTVVVFFVLFQLLIINS